MQYLYFLLFAAVIGIFHEEVFQIISTVLETTVTIIGLYLFFKLIWKEVLLWKYSRRFLNKF